MSSSVGQYLWRRTVQNLTVNLSAKCSGDKLNIQVHTIPFYLKIVHPALEPEHHSLVPHVHHSIQVIVQNRVASLGMQRIVLERLQKIAVVSVVGESKNTSSYFTAVEQVGDFKFWILAPPMS